VVKQAFTFVACLAFLMASVRAGPAADNVTYTGKYSADRPKIAADGASSPTLEVLQTEKDVQITRVELGRKTTSRCPLNGTEGDYMSPGGDPGRCKAELKGKNLMVESIAIIRPRPRDRPVRMHTKERWSLSADSKTLIIESNVDFPDFSADVSAAASGNTTGTMKYTRIDRP
jgi:hypothetical protein